MLPEKNTFLLPQGKGSKLSREFLASRFFFFDPSLFHKIGMEISTDYNLSACLKHQRSDLVFPQPKLLKHNSLLSLIRIRKGL